MSEDTHVHAEKGEHLPSRPFVVVLTGGPSSGKSSALALLRDRLTARGFQVLTCPENATHFLANSEGFQPEWAGTFKQVQMQRIFLDYQLAQEEAFKAFAALHPTKRAVLLLDCCTLNSRVYVSEDQWKQVLDFPGAKPVNEDELMARYDLVVHMVTCALSSHYEWGPGSNNPARYHTPEQANEQDAKCLQVFGSHPQLRVVPHCERFGDKIEKVVEFVNDALHIEGLIGKRRRRTVQVVDDKALVDMLDRESTSASLVQTIFMDKDMHHSVRRRARISNKAWVDLFHSWKMSVGCGANLEKSLAGATDFLYERRSQVVSPNSPTENYLTRRVIQAEEYYSVVRSQEASAESNSKDRVAQPPAKFVLRFLEGSSYFELLFFVGGRDLICDLSAEETVQLPSCLQFAGKRDLTRQDSGSKRYPLEEINAEVKSEQNTKKRRILRPHSTEEAALFRATHA